MRARLAQLARRLARRQAQVLFAVLFFGFLSPYACLLRLAGRGATRSGGWFAVRDDVTRVEQLRRTF